MSKRKKRTIFCFPLGCAISIASYLIIIGMFVGYVIAEPVKLHEFIIACVAISAVAIGAAFTTGFIREDA